MKEGISVSRRGQIAKRDVLPDPLYNSKLVTKLINNIMLDGKKGVAQKIVENDEHENPNQIQLTGTLCKAPAYRTTPFGREIADMMLAVNRAYGKSDYIPCITWGRSARFAAKLDVGDKITLTGRLQSRAYQKQMPDGSVIEKTAYEVSVGHLELLDGAHNADPAQAHPAHAFHAEAAQPQ